MIKNIFKTFIILLTTISLVGCSYRPIFDPNVKYKSVGEEQAQKDADVCMKEADDYLYASKKRRMLKEGARSSAWGAIFGSIFGFLFGGNARSLAVGAAAGAGIGAVAGAGGVAGEGKLNPDQMKQRYTAKCLGEQGYEILGWE